MSEVPPPARPPRRTSGRGSHPPTLLTRMRRAIVDHALFAAGDVVLAACSGGPDSMALVHGLARLRARNGFELVVASIDHGLRPEAAEEIALVRALAERLDVPHHAMRVDVPRGGNLQSRARDARLAALASIARSVGARHVATGHTADDRAETLLMRLVRGTGVDGLAVLPPSAKMPLLDALDLTLVRPLHRCRRADVLAHLHRHAVAYAEDPSNRDARFLRARVRSELVPALETMNPRVVDAICALADSALDAVKVRGGPSPIRHARAKAAPRKPALSRDKR